MECDGKHPYCVDTSHAKSFQRLIKEITAAVVRITQAADAVVEDTAVTEAPCKSVYICTQTSPFSYVDSASSVAATSYTLSSII